MKRILLVVIVLSYWITATQGQAVRKIGENYGGGIIFYVSPDSIHGLIAEKVDQGICNFIEAKSIVRLGVHSKEGEKYNDWRLPNIGELVRLSKNQEIVGGFCSNYYWSSTIEDLRYAWISNLALNSSYDEKFVSIYENYSVRAVRDF